MSSDVRLRALFGESLRCMNPWSGKTEICLWASLEWNKYMERAICSIQLHRVEDLNGRCSSTPQVIVNGGSSGGRIMNCSTLYENHSPGLIPFALPHSSRDNTDEKYSNRRRSVATTVLLWSVSKAESSHWFISRVYWMQRPRVKTKVGIGLTGDDGLRTGSVTPD